MSLRYLLDTNIVSAPFRQTPPHGVVETLERRAHECAIPIFVWHELRYGCDLLGPSRRKDALERYLGQVVLPTYRLLEYTRPAAEWHAAERARLARTGETPPLLDGLIAAVARAHDLILVTDNTKDFRTFDGIELENWLEPA